MPALQLDFSATQPNPSLVPPLDTPSLPTPSFMAQGRRMQLQRIEVEVEIGEPEPRPTDMLLGTLTHGAFRVVKAIPVHLVQRDEGIVAIWQEINEFGVGKSSSAALADLGHTAAELYQTLYREQDRLGPDLIRVWEVLQEHIKCAVR